MASHNTGHMAAQGDHNVLYILALAAVYACLSVVYFVYFAEIFYLQDPWNCGIKAVIPLPYIALAALFIFCYSSITRQDAKRLYAPVAAMAIALPLFLLIADLKIKMISLDPFSWGRNVYRAYTETYCAAALSIFFISSGIIYHRIIREKGLKDPAQTARDAILHLPILIYLAFIEALFLANGLIFMASFLFTLFLTFLLSGSTVSVCGKLVSAVKKTLRHEAVIPAAIFLLAFLVRCLWGSRIAAMTGNNFVIASDDGLGYDKMASIIAQGRLIPKSEAFTLNGFGYWYFLGYLYKMFGMQNFKAVIAAQALLGSSVPVLAYLAGKRIFNSRLPALIAGVLLSINLTLVFLSVVIGMEALYIPLFFLAVTAASYFLTSVKFDYKKAFVMGGLFGLANLARGELLCAPFILSALVYVFMRRLMKPGQMLFIVIAVFSGFAALASIQHVASYVMYGEYHLAQTALAGNFASARFSPENAVLNGMGFNPFSGLGPSIAVLIQDPITVCRLLIAGFSRRLVIYYLQPNFGVFDPIFLVNPSSGYRFAFPLFLQFCGYVFIIFGIIAALAKKENRAAKTLLLALTAYISSIYAFIMLQNSRNRGVLIPMASLFLSYGVYRLLDRVKSYYRSEDAR